MIEDSGCSVACWFCTVRMVAISVTLHSTAMLSFAYTFIRACAYILESGPMMVTVDVCDDGACVAAAVDGSCVGDGIGAACCA